MLPQEVSELVAGVLEFVVRAHQRPASAFGRRDDEGTTRFERPLARLHEALGVFEVFDGFERNHGVELLLEGHVVGVGVRQESPRFP